MLEQIVKITPTERIQAPLFSGPNFNNQNAGPGTAGSGIGGGMGGDINNGTLNNLKPPTHGLQGPEIKYAGGYDFPETKVQLHIHEDENGCLSHLKDYDRNKVGETLNSYETAMVDYLAKENNINRLPPPINYMANLKESVNKLNNSINKLNNR